jgi:hypothetical protein
MSGVFDFWQPKYAARGIATFPVNFEVEPDGKIKKVPAVRHWPKIRERASTELTRRFGDAEGIGVVLGRRSGLAVVDIDSQDDNLVADAMAYHGKSPLVVRSPSGGLHVYYRHDGRQRRQVRSHPFWKARSAPVDVLGGGMSVVPGSRSPKGSYKFIEGGIDDLARLPVLRVHRKVEPECTRETVPANPLRGMHEHDGRNDALFRAIGPVARQVHGRDGTSEQLVEIARRLNSECPQPMDDSEVQQIAASVWDMTVQGRNRIGRAADIDAMLDCQDAFVLLMFLRAHNAGTFMVANGLTSILRWTRKRLALARNDLIERGYLVQTHRAGRGHPALFRFNYPHA